MRSNPLCLAVISTAVLVVPALTGAAPERSTGNIPENAQDGQKVAEWILARQYTDTSLPASLGGIRVHHNPGTAGIDPYRQVNPYFASQAVLGLLDSDHARRLDAAEGWINWYLGHMLQTTTTATSPIGAHLKGSVLDHWYQDRGASQEGGASETTCPPGIAPTLCNHEDAADSYAALLLSVVDRYVREGGARARAFLQRPGMEEKLETIAQVILTLQEADGLTWARDDVHTKYLMDNSEVYAGLRAIQAVKEQVYGDTVLAATYGTAAEDVRKGILGDADPRFAEPLYDPGTGLFYTSKDSAGTRLAPDFTVWYPDQQAIPPQVRFTVGLLWPHLHGVVPGDGPIAQRQMLRVTEEWDGSPGRDWRLTTVDENDFVWPSAGYAAHLAGDDDSAVTHAEYVKCRKFPAFDYPFHVGEAGFLLSMIAAGVAVPPGTMDCPAGATAAWTKDPCDPGQIAFASAASTVAEDVGRAAISVQRSGGTCGIASVDFQTADASAQQTEDYTPAAGSLTWNDGQSGAKSIFVDIANDSTAEAEETFVISLGNAAGAALGSPATAVFTIVDDDDLPPPGTLSFSSASYSANEAGLTATITVNRVGGSAGAASVQFATSNGTATAGADYTAASGTLNWTADDAAAKTFSVSITDDTADEPDETINLTLSNVSGAALGTEGSALLTIVDDDPPPPPGTLSFSSVTYSVNEAGPTATITVNRTGGSAGVASVQFSTGNGTATGGADYAATGGTLNWAADDAAAKTFSVSIADDIADEPDETINLTLSNASGAALGTTSAAVLTIVDDDAPPSPGTLSFSGLIYSTDEASPTVTITVNRSGGSAGAASVQFATSNGTAIAGADYSATNGILNWAAGDAASKTFSVSIIDDIATEPDETVNLRLSAANGAALGAPSSAVLTVMGNDPRARSGGSLGVSTLLGAYVALVLRGRRRISVIKSINKH